MGVSAIRLPSETIFSYELKINSVFGVPTSVSAGGLAMDLDRAMVLVKALDGDQDKPKQFMLASGMNSSALEHSVSEQLFSAPENPAYGISAVKALKIANDQGIPIYTINQTNIDTILLQLQLDTGTITDIKNAGMEVTVSRTEITYNGWTGCGYIIIDPTTGAGAYMISGGMSGAWVYAAWFSGLIVLVVVAAIGTSIALAGLITLIVPVIAEIVSYTIALAIYWIPMAILAYYICSSHIPSPAPDWLQELCALFLTIISALGI